MRNNVTRRLRLLAVRPLLTLLFLSLGALPAYAQAYGDSTAMGGFDEVMAAAEAKADGVELLAVLGADVSLIDGSSPSWVYLFGVDGTANFVAVVRDGDTVAAIDASALVGGTMVLGNLIGEYYSPKPIGMNWVDSDTAVRSSDQIGGNAFRSSHEQTRVSALLVSIPLTISMGDVLLNRPLWLVTYSSPMGGDYKLFVVDGATGTPIMSVDPTTSDYNRPAADAASTDFAADAMLVSVQSVLPDVSAMGKSMLWEYLYYSPNMESYQALYVIDGAVVTTMDPLLMPPSHRGLPQETISLEEALSIGVDSLTVYGDEIGALVQARLTRGVAPDGSDNAVWVINYYVISTQRSYTVYVDATNGNVVVVGNEDGNGSELPEALRLSQNYPNPFGTATRIAYTLKEAGQASVTVYDALGREVRTLTQGMQAAGSHEVAWDGRNAAGAEAAGGLYLYRLRSGNESRTRTMILVR